MIIKAIVTGSTGMVGEGVLYECLHHPEVESVLVINRRPCNVKHSKLKEIIHNDFLDFSRIKDELKGYNACFHCMGVSSIGMKEDEFTEKTYNITMALANMVNMLNPGITFCYISGAGTDSSEQGSMMWARVKGKTENQLLKLFNTKAYMFRPGYIQPTEGLNNAYKISKVLAPLFPMWKFLVPKYVCTLKEIGLAMINSVNRGYEKQVLEVPDIINLAQRNVDNPTTNS